VAKQNGNGEQQKEPDKNVKRAIAKEKKRYAAIHAEVLAVLEFHRQSKPNQ
jgi:hypothetical protein